MYPAPLSSPRSAWIYARREGQRVRGCLPPDHTIRRQAAGHRREYPNPPKTASTSKTTMRTSSQVGMSPPASMVFRESTMCSHDERSTNLA